MLTLRYTSENGLSTSSCMSESTLVRLQFGSTLDPKIVRRSGPVTTNTVDSAWEKSDILQGQKEDGRRREKSSTPLRHHVIAPAPRQSSHTF